MSLWPLRLIPAAGVSSVERDGVVFVCVKRQKVGLVSKVGRNRHEEAESA